MVEIALFLQACTWKVFREVEWHVKTDHMPFNTPHSRQFMTPPGLMSHGEIRKEELWWR